MGNVNNRKCIRNLSMKSMKTARLRNGVAILAIALTTMLFTSLFTIAGSINASFEQMNFRQAGGSFHGVFKDIDEEQEALFRQDALIKRAGARRILGMPNDAPFLKSHVEVGYADAVCADSMFCVPEEGRLPEEGTREAATDTRVLSLLGVEPELGAEFTITYELGTGTPHPQPVTETFTLCGWWEYDEAVTASHVLVPESYVNEMLENYEPQGSYDITGRTDLYVDFKNAFHIREDLYQVLENNGYTGEDTSAENYVSTGINWGYTGAQLSSSMDMGTVLGIAAAVVLIVFTGYLIIYNIFRISVAGDIRFYGLIKTIGATSRQIRRMLRRQALFLCLFGIPIGLAAGWAVGAGLMPVIMSNMSYHRVTMSASPWIFIGSAVFSFLTVLLSCSKPARLAGKVSPVEAVRYTESNADRRKQKKGRNGAKISRMAFTNLGRSRLKTALVVVSLALAVVLLNVTVAFTQGFDMDKYLQKYVCTDFIFGHADYFRSDFGTPDQGVTEEQIAQLEAVGGIKESGRIFGQTSLISQHMPEEVYRELWWKNYYTPEELDRLVAMQDRDENGLLLTDAQLYGMEEFPLSKLDVLEGDLTQLGDGAHIAAVVEQDDYDDPIAESQHCQVGDELTVTFVDEYTYVDSRTQQPADDSTPEEFIELKIVKSHEKVYTVCARVTMRGTMGYRFYGKEQFILPAGEFCQETGTNTVMTYIYDVEESANAQMEAFLKTYTEIEEPAYDFESKALYVSNFESFRSMFLLMGGALSGVIGFIGILNFINAVVTSVVSRKREFAVLQAVGMTGSQLVRMLMLEGCLYGLLAVAAALILSIVFAPALGQVLEGMFWFYTSKFTVLPVLSVLPLFLLIGMAVPVIAYHFLARQSVVERIRQAE